MTPRPDHYNFNYRTSDSSDNYEWGDGMREVIDQMLKDIREKNARGSIKEGEVEEEKEFLSEEDMEI